MHSTRSQAEDSALTRRTVEKGPRSPRWTMRLLVPALVATTVATFGYPSSVDTREDAGRVADTQVQPVDLHLSADEQARWLRSTGTPAGRAEVVAALRDAFAGVATVGSGSPESSAPTNHGVRNVAFSANSSVRTAWDAGMASDHFWIIVSYADVASGAIWAAVRACQARLPSWLCTSAGNLLTQWAQGWGAAHNHGLWAAIYWWPPRITGGRW